MKPGPPTHARETERAVRPIRWLGAAFVLVQIGFIYSPADGSDLPFQRFAVAVPLAAVLVATNLVSRHLERTASAATLRRAGVVETLVDLGIVIAMVVLFSFDTESRLWPLYTLPVLEGALREGVRGALATTGLAFVAIVATGTFLTTDEAGVVVSAAVFRGGILVIVAVATGTLATRLGRIRAKAEEQARRLAHLSTLSRRLSAERRRDRVLELLLESTRELTGISAGEVYLRTGDGEWSRRARAGLGEDEELLGEAMGSLEIVERGEPVVSVPPRDHEDAYRQVLVARIGEEGPTAALLLVAVRADDPPLTAADEDLVRLLAAQGGVALRNARLAEQEAEAVEELRTLDEVKSEFMHVLAHEMRGPMTAMAGYAAMLNKRWETLSDARRESALDAIEQGTQRLAKLVRDIQEAMDADRRELPIHPERLDLRPIIESAAGTEVEPSEDHRLELDLPDDLPDARADGDRVVQVLSNLLSNAVKYSPDGGRIRVAACRDDGMVRVEVTDDGFGIPAHLQDHLFQKFSRLPTPKSVGGTGLGLYLSRVLVESMGGHIEVDSEEGRGSTFSFTLPAANRTSDPAGRDESATTRDART